MFFDFIISLSTECRLLITFANSLDSDQARHNVGPDMGPNCLTRWWYSWKNFSKKLILQKISRWQKSIRNHRKLVNWQKIRSYFLSKSVWLECQSQASFLAGHMQTVQTKIRCHRMWYLIRVSTVCLQNVQLKFE